MELLKSAWHWLRIKAKAGAWFVFGFSTCAIMIVILGAVYYKTGDIQLHRKSECMLMNDVRKGYIAVEELSRNYISLDVVRENYIKKEEVSRNYVSLIEANRNKDEFNAEISRLRGAMPSRSYESRLCLGESQAFHPYRVTIKYLSRNSFSRKFEIVEDGASHEVEFGSTGFSKAFSTKFGLLEVTSAGSTVTPSEDSIVLHIVENEH
ncbi:hypothetical protein [Nibricoccus sp. IMCC34717]|uniref:hypothetical protein n=1 Tax=Nibricoccus sp. IMCC34717 TaxID=3034021 RepID=UPI00384ABE0B